MAYYATEDGDFEFGFNNINFSDRELHLDITPAPPVDGANDSEHDNTKFVLKKLHVSSLMLAAKSPYFFKLFNTGMKGSQRTDKVTLKINASEEAAFMDLLKFMYGIPMTASSAQDLVDVLITADKFAVPSCVRHCFELLKKLPMTTKDAVMYLDLSSSIWGYEEIQTLCETANQYLAAHFRDFTKYQLEVYALTLSALKIVLGSDGLKVSSKDDLFDFTMNWAFQHYPELEERQQILTEHLMPYINLANMSSFKLMEMAECPEFYSEQALELLLSALKSKDQVLTDITMEYNFPRRVYTYKLIKVVQFQLAQPRCLVYFDVTKEELADLVPSEQLYFQKFCLGGQYLRLFAECSEEEGKFGLFLTKTEGSEDCALKFEFAVMNKVSKEFRIEFESSDIVLKKDMESWGCPDLFGMALKDFLKDENEYIIDGIIHFRVDVTLIN